MPHKMTMLYMWIILGLTAAPSYALDSDPQQPIEIEADLMILDEQAGISIYRGHVKLVQGSIRINAAELTIYSKDKAVERMQMQGDAAQRASFQQQTINGEEANGQAMRIEYDAQKAKLVLLEQAELKQGNNFIKSARIDYNTANNKVIAGQQPSPSNPDNTDNSRVKMVIKPKANTNR